MCEELVKRLREKANEQCFIGCFGKCSSCEIEVVLCQAADAIEKLQKELETSKDFEAFWQHEAEEALRKFQVAIAQKPQSKEEASEQYNKAYADEYCNAHYFL